ncbi:MAG: TetR/AcrR family transcriptional regulator [Prevotellaceae bacterium]|jgi:AcrR family transcriptional regulator|nr:TetR/AcrR family transcriptional regulator [Prevotellaceae bacterium]
MTKQQIIERQKALRANIWNIGLKLYATKGFSATTVADIAKLTGASHGPIYQYFGSKEDLYVELVIAAVKKVDAIVSAIADKPISPADKIMRLTKIMLQHIKEDDATAYYYLLLPQALLLHDIAPRKAKTHIRRTYLIIEKIQRIISEGQRKGVIKRGNPQALSTLFLASITGLCAYKALLGEDFVPPQPHVITIMLLKPQSAEQAESQTE